MIAHLKKHYPWLCIFVVIFTFFSPVFKGLLPAPFDTIIGLYHPFRDLYADNYPNGIPFNNPLITDPIRQIIPWKLVALDSMKNLDLPLWNPYSGSGTPLLANFQSSVFYPLSIILFAKPFVYSWTVFIMLQQLLSACFMYLYLKNLRLNTSSSLIGSISFSFSGFVVAWLEWGTIVHTLLWLPLILLSIDRLTTLKIYSLKQKQCALWSLTFLLSIIFSFFAGHFQTFMYIMFLSVVYFFGRWTQNNTSKKLFITMLIYSLVAVAITSVQWIPTLRFFALSARSVDIVPFQNPGWFMPLKHFVQFVAPDFFGNPSTLNYWGEWNYAEFVGYIGVIPFILALVAFGTKRRIVKFYSVVVLVTISFMLPLPHTRVLYEANIPFLSSAQPTRMLSILCFSLATLSAFGFQMLQNPRTKKQVTKVLTIIFIMCFIFLLLWKYVLTNNSVSVEQLQVAKRNLILPTVLLLLGTSLLIGAMIAKKNMRTILIYSIIVVISFDLIRFATKFESFSKPEYFFPQTKVTEFLKKDTSIYRIATTDSRVMPPNFSSVYSIQSIETYDPLYLKDYAEFIVNNERCCGDISPPYGFNRIITPRNIFTNNVNFLNVKYILSLEEIEEENIVKVFEEGQTKVYENENVFPRTFFVKQTIKAPDLEDHDENYFKMLKSTDLSRIAIVDKGKDLEYQVGTTKISHYTENRVEITTKNDGRGFLVFSDTYYPTWKAKIDGKETKIYKTNHAFRGVEVPEGEHKVVFYNSLF